MLKGIFDGQDLFDIIGDTLKALDPLSDLEETDLSDPVNYYAIEKEN